MVRPAWVSPAARPFWILPISFFFPASPCQGTSTESFGCHLPPCSSSQAPPYPQSLGGCEGVVGSWGGSGLPSPLSLQLCAVSAVGQGELVSLIFPDPAPVWRHFCRATSILPCAPAEDSLHEFSLIALRQPSSDQLLCLSVGVRWLLGNSSRRSRRIPPV